MAGTAVLHSLNWTDNIGLSGYIFSFDNCTGSLVNDTNWVSFGGATWSNVTKKINTTAGCTIRWCVYANDSSNNWNGTSCQNPFSYVTIENIFVVNMEAGGPYVKNTVDGSATVLIVGNVSWPDGTAVPSAAVDIDISKTDYSSTDTITASSSGRFSLSKTLTQSGVYTVNVTATYSGTSRSTIDTFEISDSLQGCTQQTISLSGIALDFDTGNRIESGTAKIIIKENGDENTVDFTNGTWIMTFSSCLLSGTQHTAIIQITDSSTGKTSWSQIEFIAP